MKHLVGYCIIIIVVVGIEGEGRYYFAAIAISHVTIPHVFKQRVNGVCSYYAAILTSVLARVSTMICAAVHVKEIQYVLDLEYSHRKKSNTLYYQISIWEDSTSIKDGFLYSSLSQSLSSCSSLL